MSEENIQHFVSANRSFTSDIEICTNHGKSFLVNRLMLVEYSPFFSTLLNGTFKKYQSLEGRKMTRIHLNMSQADLFPVLARVMYGEGEIHEKNVVSMITTASFLGIVSVVNECESFLIHGLNFENAVEFYRFGSDNSFMNLKSTALNYILENFSLVTKGKRPYIQDLPELYLIKILSHDGIQCNEEEVWMFILTWSRTNKTKPSLSLLSTIRFGLMEPKYFRTKVAPHPFILNTGIVEEYEELNTTLDFVSKTPNFANPRGFSRQIEKEEEMILEDSSSSGFTPGSTSDEDEDGELDDTSLLLQDNIVMDLDLDLMESDEDWE